MPESKNEIIVYQPDETIRLEVRLENDTVWLTQSQMAQLFGCTIKNISVHLKNIYQYNELQEDATKKENFIVQIEGQRKISRMITFYNLDAIISVGYRVNSILGVRFRQWATQVLKNYLLRGYAVNDRLDRLETKVARHDEQIGLFLKTALPANRSNWMKKAPVPFWNTWGMTDNNPTVQSIIILMRFYP